jgi:hypothetical protein
MSDYDLRQYKLILENVKVPILNLNTLKKTIDNLEGLIYAIEEKDDIWNQQFMMQWWILEDIYAEICSTERPSLSISAVERLNQTRLVLFELVNQKI